MNHSQDFADAEGITTDDMDEVLAANYEPCKCPMCNGTGYKDFYGFAIDVCECKSGLEKQPT